MAWRAKAGSAAAGCWTLKQGTHHRHACCLGASALLWHQCRCSAAQDAPELALNEWAPSIAPCAQRLHQLHHHMACQHKQLSFRLMHHSLPCRALWWLLLVWMSANTGAEERMGVPPISGASDPTEVSESAREM